MTVRIRVCGAGEQVPELASLRRWLADERALAGAVRMNRAQTGPEDLGNIVDALEVAVASGGALTVLARSVSTWIQHRRVEVEITHTDTGRSLVVRGVDDPTEIIEKFLEHGD
jgi:hypothetical protein